MSDKAEGKGKLNLSEIAYNEKGFSGNIPLQYEHYFTCYDGDPTEPVIIGSRPKNQS